MGETAILRWEWPDLPERASAPEAFMDVAKEIEATMASRKLTQFVPRWNSAGRYQPVNPLVNLGFFTVRAGICDIGIYQAYGAYTSGGSGALGFELPFPSSWPYEQWTTAKLWIPSFGRVNGIGLISGQRIQPLFPVASNQISLGHWRSTVDPIAVGTGIPTVPAAWTIQDGGNFVMTGRYRVNA